mmetsp:Transcript_66220/g.142918  ORF Transcript_66220/g.142918 Transcript_66220/m.142918 type:complete len:212 (-) Transcript_66220:1169-1804(-)
MRAKSGSTVSLSFTTSPLSPEPKAEPAFYSELRMPVSFKDLFSWVISLFYLPFFESSSDDWLVFLMDDWLLSLEVEFESTRLFELLGFSVLDAPMFLFPFEFIESFLSLARSCKVPFVSFVTLVLVTKVLSASVSWCALAFESTLFWPALKVAMLSAIFSVLSSPMSRNSCSSALVTPAFLKLRMAERTAASTLRVMMSMSSRLMLRSNTS